MRTAVAGASGIGRKCTNGPVLLACAVLEGSGLHDVLRRAPADLGAVLRALGLELGVHALAVAQPHEPEDCELCDGLLRWRVEGAGTD